MIEVVGIRTSQRYAIGLRHQAAVRQLASLDESDTLADAVALIGAYPSLHEELISRLVKMNAPAETRLRIANLLKQHHGWLATHRHEIGLWLEAAGVQDANHWLADLHAYPRSARLDVTWRVRSWRSHRELPGGLFLTPQELATAPPAELSDGEEYFVAHRLFAAKPEKPESALRLLAAAQRVQAEPVVAALFASGRLTSLCVIPAVVSAFHALPWERFGILKQRFCAAISTAEDPRLSALAQWARGNLKESLDAYRRVVVPADPVMVREYLVIVAAARAAADPDLLATLTGYEADWLQRLTAPMRRTHAALTALASAPLPPADDPLFALAVSFTHRQLVRSANTDELLAEFARRASDIDPAWRRYISHVEWEYANVWAGVRSSDGAAFAGAVLERLLLLPVDVDWLSMILSSVQAFPPEWFASEDDITTPMSDVAIASCIRIVECLTNAGYRPNEDQQRRLCSGSAVAIVQTTLNLMNEQRSSA